VVDLAAFGGPESVISLATPRPRRV
jgi:hypothetical protein